MRVKAILMTAAAAALLAAPAEADPVSCKMTFDLSGWSFVYKQMKGEGKISCSNGQSAAVHVSSHGGGFTIGKSDIVDGKGTFSGAKDIDEVFGTYAQADASGSTVKGGQAQVMTKGEISLALSGSGRGWDVGVSIGGFTITKKE